MKYLVYAIVIMIFMALTSGLFASFRLAGVVPDLIFLMTVIAAIEFESRDFLFVALLGGIWMDISYGLPIGSFALGYVLAGGLAYALFHRPASLEFAWKYFFSTVAGTLALLYLWLWLYSTLLASAHISPVSASLSQIIRHFPFVLIYNLLAAAPLYLIFNQLARFSAKLSRKPLRL